MDMRIAAQAVWGEQKGVIVMYVEASVLYIYLFGSYTDPPSYEGMPDLYYYIGVPPPNYI